MMDGMLRGRRAARVLDRFARPRLLGVSISNFPTSERPEKEDFPDQLDLF